MLIMLKYCLVILFLNLPFRAIAIIPMPVLLLCSYYAHFIIENRTQRGTSIAFPSICMSTLSLSLLSPAGVRLFPLFVLTAVTDGQNVTVLMLVVASLRVPMFVVRNHVLLASICNSPSSSCGLLLNSGIVV